MPGRSQNPRPLGDRVIVKVLDKQQGTLRPSAMFGPILMVDSDGEVEVGQLDPPTPRPARGVLTAVGPGTLMLGRDNDDPMAKAYVPMELKVGDEVLFYSEVGVPVTIDDEDLVVVPEQAILVVLSSMTGEPAVFEGAESDADDGG